MSVKSLRDKVKGRGAISRRRLGKKKSFDSSLNRGVKPRLFFLKNGACIPKEEGKSHKPSQSCLPRRKPWSIFVFIRAKIDQDFCKELCKNIDNDEI